MISKCSDCDFVIGGDKHILLDTNRYVSALIVHVSYSADVHYLYHFSKISTTQWHDLLTGFIINSFQTMLKNLLCDLNSGGTVRWEQGAAFHLPFCNGAGQFF